MTDSASLRQLCLQVVDRAGLRAVGELFHSFGLVPAASPGGLSQGGVTGVVLLAESHLAVHTWPELSAVTLDVYVCNLETDNSAMAHRVLEELIAAFVPQQVERRAMERGRVSNRLEEDAA